MRVFEVRREADDARAPGAGVGPGGDRGAGERTRRGTTHSGEGLLWRSVQEATQSFGYPAVEKPRDRRSREAPGLTHRLDGAQPLGPDLVPGAPQQSLGVVDLAQPHVEPSGGDVVHHGEYLRRMRPLVAFEPARPVVVPLDVVRATQRQVALLVPGERLAESARILASIHTRLLLHLRGQQVRVVTHRDAQASGRLRPDPVQGAEVPAFAVVDDRRLVRDVRVALAPLEQAVDLVLAQEPGRSHRIARARPELDEGKGHLRDLRVRLEDVEDAGHVLGQVELVDVHLPQVVAGGQVRVGARLRGAASAELVGHGPEAVPVTSVTLCSGSSSAMKRRGCRERAVGGVAVGVGHLARPLVASLHHDDLERVRVERAEAVAGEGLAVEDDDAERDARTGTHVTDARLVCPMLIRSPSPRGRGAGSQEPARRPCPS